MTAPFAFLKTLESSNSITPMLNYSPIFDMLNGEYVVGIDGITFLNGGESRNNAITGGNNTQKTGLLVLAMARPLIRFSTSVVFMVDIESHFSVSRLEEMIDREMGIPGYFKDKILNKRFFYFNRNDNIDGTWVHNFFKDVNTKIKEEIKDKAQIHIDTPFMGDDGKRIKIINPSIAAIDSISEMHFSKVSAHFQEGDVDEGGEKRTRDMQIGNMRRICYEDADILGAEVGMYQFWTAQVVDIINMTGKPLEKDSVFIRQGKKLKAPKSLLRLPQIGIEIIRGSALKSGNEWMYPNPFGKDVEIDADAKENPDLLFYAVAPYRNKGGSSGNNLFFIGSQSLGIQEGLTMYHAMKTSGMFGLEGNDRSHVCVLLPSEKIGRTTVWEKTLNPNSKLFRALVICWQMLQMQKTWVGLEAKYRISPQELYEKITTLGLSWDTILEETVDYWHSNPDIKKKTVSTMELIKVAIGEREAYWIK